MGATLLGVAVLEILHVGHPTLRERAREITREELAGPEMQGFLDDLVETMRAAKGAGLAAPQVGRGVRVCAIEVEANPRYPHVPTIPLTLLVNPRLRAVGEETFENAEGCLSVPDLRGLVTRHAEVEVVAWDRTGTETTRLVRGLEAGVYQHETDHLDGRLFLDRADPRSLCTRAMWDAHHRAAYLARMGPFFGRTSG